jgi:hypothetical protein
VTIALIVVGGPGRLAAAEADAHNVGSPSWRQRTGTTGSELFAGGTMPSRRDILKATGGLVLATGGSWLASHAHAADTSPESVDRTEISGRVEALGEPIADAGDKAPLESPR